MLQIGPPSVGASQRHPFDVHLGNAYRKALRTLKLQLRVREARQVTAPKPLKGQPKPLTQYHPAGPAVHLPMPYAVKPPVTS